MQVEGESASPIVAASAARWSPAWTIESASATVLVLSAGADRRLAVDGLRPTTLDAAGRWQADGSVDAADDEQRLLLDRLVDVGAVTVAALGARRVAVHWIGEPDEALADALHGTGLELVDVGAAMTTLLVVRTEAMPAPAVDCPHLGVDLTLHHTVLLGPFVVPGVTACLGCLDQRSARRWGRPSVPPRPGIRQRPAVVAQLIAVQVGLAAAGRSPLVNATVAWDLEQGTTNRQSLYKLVGCTTCDVARPTGRVALAWAAP